MTDDSELTADMIRQHFEELEQLGLIRRTGEFRKGKPVFTLTELGRTVLSSDAPTTMQ